MVELNGLDIYDPMIREIRSSSVDDIACWFIDTNYNSESFFVRHAYFTGANQPYEKLKRTLKAEIDEDTWESFYSSVSRAFEPPKSRNGKPGKIAVKLDFFLPTRNSPLYFFQELLTTWKEWM
ncbi:hypothetical protein [Gloeothece citriformis]|uniref:hypothetical protein n=1 Tax=Gloeothece citriformis TaxID=2546356 RepID=UPI000173C73C|nr:hypothetical protein [Gloeothece citriformis]